VEGGRVAEERFAGSCRAYWERVMQSPQSKSGPRLTRTGAVWGLLFAISMPAVLATFVWAPDSLLAQLVSTSRGRGEALVALAAVFILVGYLLNLLNYPILHPDDEL